ncbi:phosphoesterase [Bacillus sp. SA1-12]|nr:GapA-binding peptide SR1P [Bacillus sp. SA1-12]KKI92928.1 phosphoesterase [Bacillus sp. SA1-12]
MGTLICKDCNSTFDYFEDDKVTVLYSKCECCENKGENGGENASK